MKSAIAVFAGALSICTLAFGQSNPTAQTSGSNPSPQIQSPVIQADGKVTFSLYAPDAASVALSGQLYPAISKQQMRTGMSMTKGANGVWSLTIGPMQPQFYEYYFLVDGVKTLDPSNQHTAYGMSWFMPAGGFTSLMLWNKVPHGTVSQVWYPSPGLGMPTRRMVVYTPPGYEEGTSRYPVLYLLHGGNASEMTWLESGRVPQILDNVIAQGKAVPMIVVLPNGNETQTLTNAEADVPEVHGPPMQAPPVKGVASPASNSEVAGQRAGGPGTAGAPGGPGGQTSLRFPDSLVSDLIPFMDKHYRTKADRENRAIIGLSLGAQQTVATLFRHIDTFAWGGVFSAEVRQISGAAPNSKFKLRQFFWCTPNDEAATNASESKKVLDQAGISYKLDSLPNYSTEFWRPGLVDYVSSVFQPAR